MATVTEIRSEIESLLSDANGRRRVRTLGLDAVAQVLREAMRDGFGGARGGWVANCYGYPAITTRAAAFSLENGSIVVGIGTGNAKKNGGCGPGFGPVEWSARRLPQLRAWAALDVGAPELNYAGNRTYSLAETDAIVLTRAQARRFCRDLDRAAAAAEAATEADRLALRRAAWGELPAELASIQVRLVDSLSAGNCAAETERIHAALGAPASISAADLWAWCVAHEPTSLAFFVRRAIEAARLAQLATA